MEDEDRRKNLINLKVAIESPAFQEMIAKPMKEYMREQNNNFFSDNLKDSWRKGGRVEAVKKFFSLIGDIDTDLKNLS